MTKSLSWSRSVCKACAAVASLSPVVIFPSRSSTSYSKTAISFLRDTGREDLFQRCDMLNGLAQPAAAQGIHPGLSRLQTQHPQIGPVINQLTHRRGNRKELIDRNTPCIAGVATGSASRGAVQGRRRGGGENQMGLLLRG